MAALALILAGCSSNEDDVKIDKEGTNKAVPIQISQKVAGVETKAATNSTEVTANIIMVDASAQSSDTPDFDAFTPRTSNKLTSGSFASDDDRANVATATFSASTIATTLNVSPILYYPSSSTKTFILGVAPTGTVSKDKVTFSTVDGYQDVMFAEKKDAGSASNAAPANGESNTNTVELEFAHQTAQLVFVSKLSTTTFTDTEWDGKTVTVKTITIQNAEVPATIALNGGEIEWSQKNIDVAGCAEKLTTTACAKSIPVMIKPVGKVTVDLVLELSDNTIVNYNNLVIQTAKDGATGNLSIEKGKSHLVTFEITPPDKATSGTAVSVTAKVQAWETGDEGKVEIK